MIDLHGKVAIVTGAASYHGDDDPYRVGQGVATSRTLARLGAAVVMADINGAVAEERAEEIRVEAATRSPSRPTSASKSRSGAWWSGP